MERWVWLAAFLVGFALLQAALYRYLRRGKSPSEQPTAGRGARTDAPRDAGPLLAEDGPDAGGEPRPEGNTVDRVRCKHCGAPNERDAVYTYCQRCARQLQ